MLGTGHRMLKPGQFCRRFIQGIALTEVLIAAVLIGMVAIGSIQSLTLLNRDAAATRMLTNARAIVQRNIDTALSVTFTSDATSAVPAILALTSAGGAVWDDDAGNVNVVDVALQGSTGTQLVQGVLTRIVTDVAPVDAVDTLDKPVIRKITFRLDYTYRGRPFSYSLTTMRSIDD
ncbi:MAG: hypothetical protein JWL90_505 [Chthoniobacteraceae bacterium]|nr:hypothetical protein [Chthoniobacteraceae bacterium]